MEGKVLLKTEIPNKVLFARGKVRDTWEIPGLPGTDDEKLLLMITTDRISAYDSVVGGVPDLGKIRTQISLFWFELLKRICPNHIFSADQQLCARTVKKKYREPNDLIGRCVLVYPATVFPIECVVRGYLAGSAWKSYQDTGKICGIPLPSGLKEAEELPRPIFTPATKAKTGHDENITFDQMVKLVGADIAEMLRDFSLRLYIEAARWARIRGIIIADTKFEFGLYKRRIIVVDELLTPDSSRFWDVAEYRPGKPPLSFDKQRLRDWLKARGWDGTGPPPPLTPEVIDETRDIYVEAFTRLVGKVWPPKF